MPESTDASRHREGLLALCRSVIAQRPLIVVSNRGPLEYQPGPENHFIPRRRSSTVATALGALISSVDFSWVASAMGEGDRLTVEQAGGAGVRPPLPNFHANVRFVVTPRRAYHKFYNILCNPLLWFLQHYMWSPPYTPNIDATVHDAWDTGYAVVNQIFAEAVVAQARELPQAPLVMFHDYHLYLTPGLVRKQVPEAFLHYLLHIPWPAPQLWQLLPPRMRTAICQSLCACDIVGFQSRMDIHNFLACCESFVPGARVDFRAQTVETDGHVTTVRSYPLSIDIGEVQQIANSPRAKEYEQRLAAQCAEKTIVRVDRAEPNKNIVRGFQAYQLMLEHHPELKGRVKFMAFLVPSRTHIKQYERYLTEISDVVQRINTSLGTPDWQPVMASYENNYVQAIAGLKMCDVFLVNPVSDGMSLVAKEGPVVNTKDAVLVLSDSSPAYEQLKEAALGVAPADLEGTAEALYQAITMPSEERAQRATTLRALVEQEDSARWLFTQFSDIQSLLARKAGE
ncbi:MAG: trehalose-6-phosphate synthase [Dehalococcoidia bacterium]|nr:trehalose-6-phosphate synthase [Dehalococcoidia bacterium]